MELEYYTLDESAEYLGCKKSVLLHYIETKRISAVLHSKQRRFLIITWNEDQQIWEGNATVYYRGLLSPHDSWILSLLENGEISINTRVSPIRPFDIAHYSSDNPFYDNTFPPVISRWNGTHSLPSDKNIFLCPLPTQSTHPGKLLTDLVVTFTRPSDEELRKIKNEFPEAPKYAFYYSENGKFTTDDIRITKKTLRSLNVNSDKNDNFHKKLEVEKKLDAEILLNKKRRHALNELIVRIILDNPDIDSNRVWNIIKKECSNGEKIYDKECIIERVDPAEMRWENYSGHARATKKTSFASIVSRLKKQIRDTSDA